MNFTTPLALLLLLALPYFVWLGRPRTAVRRPWREWTSLAFRILIFSLLTLSLAGAQIVRAADDLAVIFLVDASDSITPAQETQAEQFIRDAIASMKPTDKAAVILFGANALVERPLSGLAELAPITTVPQRLQTDIAEAIRLGLALFPSGSARRMVILSDGEATIGNTDQAGQLAAANHVQVDFVYLPHTSVDAEAMLTNVSAPSRVSQGEAFRIDVTAESTTNTPATLRVLAGGQVVYEEAVDLREGVNNFAIRLRAAEQEFVRYRVQLTPTQDTYYQNNELAAFTDVMGPPRILLVADDGHLADDGTVIPDESPALRLALEAAGLSVDRVTPEDLSNNLPELSNYASIILVNVNAAQLSPHKMENLQSYVRDLGGGLVVVGGPESYGMGGYFKTPLEETLPVDMQIKDQERFPSVSIVIVIDRSGSMGASEGGTTKIQLAAEGAVRVVQLLNDFDEITVIPVDTEPYNPIGPMSVSQRAEAINLIREISSGGGGIYVRTGIAAAADALSTSTNQVKHIILLSDGSDSEEQEGTAELIKALTAENVTVSVVSIGEGPDTPWLEEMAKLGNGRFHLTDQAANLPQIFTQETTAIQRTYLIEERFFPTLVTSSPILAGITAVPPLYGYVGTSPKDTAQVILNSDKGDPVLAAWQYGLGRSVAWTSDASGRWGREWVTWPGFPSFWAQAVRWTISQGRESSVETVVDFSGEQAKLIVDTRDLNGRFLNNLDMTVNVVAPDGTVQNLHLPQVAPGRYEGEFLPSKEGAYLIRVAGTSADSEIAVGQTSGWVLGYSPEYRHIEASPQTLALLAEATKGRDLVTEQGEQAPLAVFTHDLPNQSTTRPIWPFLLLTAVLLWPFDIALRRLVITKQDWEKAWAATFGRLMPQTAVPVARSEQVSRLFEAKQRASGTAPDKPSGESPTTPPTILRGDAVQQTPPPTTIPSRPPSTSSTPTPSGGGSLASKLMDKKRQQQNKPEE